jgi:hypothetical protein
MLTVQEVYPIPANNFDEQAIDVLKRLIVRFQGFNKLWGGVEKLLGQDSRAD